MNRVDRRQKKLMEETRYGAKGINRGEREEETKIEDRSVFPALQGW